MKNVIKNMPIAISGTLLAILSLGNLLDYPLVKLITLIIGLLIIIILLLKLIIYPETTKEELQNPVVLSTSGTFSMALMVLSTYTTNKQLTIIIWLIGVLLHTGLIIYYTYKYIIKEFNIENYYGSLWVVYIGITMAAITGGIHGLQHYTWIFLIFGFTVMIPTIILVSYRYYKYPVTADANKPLICIYTAIFNILTVGYFNTTNQVNTTLITLLFIIATILYIYSFINMTRYIRLPFYPSYSAFTFPFVISATATTQVATYFNNNILYSLAILETLIAVVLVIYVLYQYIDKIIIKSS